MMITDNLWSAVEEAGRAMVTDAGRYDWSEDDAAMRDADADDLLAWADDCADRLGADEGDFRAALLTYIAVRDNGAGLDNHDCTAALIEATGAPRAAVEAGIAQYGPRLTGEYLLGLPALDARMVPEPWRNDAAYKFVHTLASGSIVVLWVDCASEDSRELGCSARFTAYRYADENAWGEGRAEYEGETDDADGVAAIVAAAMGDR